ncbi:MAG: C10 family peptidase, partial [Candidatus Cloacimonadales bacterium]
MNKRLLLLVVLLVVSTSALFGQVASMIQSEWNTISPWNGTCPRIGYTSADAGTGALSVAKIMKYWNYPNQGVGSVSYVDDDLGQINQSLVQSFNWERMANNLYRQETGVLIRTVAYGIKSDWELDYTTADIQDVMASMLANFSYSSSMEYHDLANTSFYQWRQMINEQLSLGRPVLYQGYAEDVDRNYFIVIDGLTVDNRYTYVTSLGTYEHYTTNLTDLNIDGHAISANNQKMLINIIPQNIEEYDESFEDGFTNNNWYFQGNAGWTIASNEAYAGTHSARPQNIAHNQSSSILIDLSVPVADNISFFIKPSCETPTEGQCDKAVFYINGVEQDEWNGIGDWTFASYALQPGTYQFKWSYIKDGSVVHGDDTVYLDAITLPSGETPLNPPRNLTAVNNTGNTVVLNWDYPEGYQRDLQGYKIYKDGSELAQSFSPGVTTYTNGNVANGLHNYAVKAIYNSGLSDYSNTAFVEIQIIYSPTNVRYTIPSVGTAWVRWDVSPLVGTYTPDSYKLYLNNEWYSDSVQNEIMLPLEEGAHLFYVTAVYDGIESPSSTVLNIVMGTLPPPTNLTATVYAGNSVHIEWTRPVTPLITGYEIYRNNQLLTSINNQTTTLYNDEDLPNGNYVYTMKTVNGNETSGPSLGASVLIMNLESPINVQSTIVNEVSVQLTWSYPSMANLLEQYKVYRNGVVVASVYNTLNPSFFDYNLANGSYDYQITAFYNGVESELSETENVVIDYPYPPRNFVATVNGSNVQLSWSVPATQGGASRAIQTYKIYKDGEIIHTINNTSTTSYTVRGVENGTYTFAIAAEYGSGMSILVEAQVTVEVFYAPQNLAYSIDGQNVTITWEAGSLSRDLLQYHLYRNGTEHATITEPTYEDMNLINGHYEYSVVAEYSSGLSEPSETISFDLEIPYPVVNLYYEIEDNNITITWERPSDGSAERSLVSYELFRDGVSLATTTALTHTDYNLINGSYDYYIVVHYTNESSQPSNPISVELIKQYPVENLAWLVQNRNNIVLTWNVNSYSGESIENFRVLRNDALLTVTNELTYSDLGLEDGAYTFSIIAVYSNGLAEAVTGETIQIEYPFPVSELATTVAEDNISLTWAYQTTDSTVFKIFRNSMFIGQTTDLNYSDEGLANGFYAYHIITANNSDSGDSIASATVSAEVSVTYPVTGLVANVVEDSINLTWNVPAVSTRALASYKVFVNDELYQENINATNYTLTQLSNGAYAIFVVATYTNGDSVPSNLVNAVVEVKYTPVNFAIITFGNNVELNWEAPTDATGILNYNIYRNNEVIAQVVNPTYTDSDLANNNYSYAITTNYNSGESAPTATETTLIEFLYIVTNLTAQIVNADFSVTWETNPLAGASIVEYQIFRDGVLVTTTENANYQSVSNANGTYETAVKAVYASGVSELSEAVTTVIDVHYPVNNIAYSIDDNNVTFTWQAHDYANNVIEYIVYRDNAELAIISELSYTDTNLSNGNYGYQVKAIYPNGESDISNMVRVTVELLYAPNNLTFNVVSDSITLNWDEPNAMYRGFIGYKLFRDEELLASQTELTYTDVGLTNGDYTYSVKAEYSSGDSEASNAVTANVEVLYPAVNLALDIEADDATLTWETNLMSGASIIDFTIYRDGENIGNIAELAYLDEALANGIYAYSVAVNYLTGSSILAQAVSGLVEVLYPPQNLSCLVETNNVLITWDVAPTSATRSFLGYRLYRDNEEIFFNETATTYNDLNLINNSYEYKLEAEYSTGISEALTALVNIEVLYPVENFTGSLTDTEINLAWENNPLAGNSIISYSLIRNSELYATLTELSYLDSALANGVYEYRVVANYNNGSALPSDDLTFNLEITYPATNLTAQVTANVVDLVWDLPASSPRALLSYNIYRDGVIVGNTEELNYSDTALTNAIYSYYVTAEYTSGESDPSNSVEAIVEVLYAPNNLTFNVVSDSITLNWDEPNAMYRGFIGYKLFRDE